MSWVADILAMANSVHNSIAADVYPHGAILRCKQCYHMELATIDDCGRYLAEGWPRHCGGHMVVEKRVPRKAYRCRILTWPGFETIWPGESRSKAIARAWYDSRDAGYYVPWVEFRATRAPEFDELARRTEGRVPWCLGWKDTNEGETWGCLAPSGSEKRHALNPSQF